MISITIPPHIIVQSASIAEGAGTAALCVRTNGFDDYRITLYNADHLPLKAALQAHSLDEISQKCVDHFAIVPEPEPVVRDTDRRGLLTVIIAPN